MANTSNDGGTGNGNEGIRVGDTVTFVLSGEPFNGHVYEVAGDIATVDCADGFIYHRPVTSLTLISRAPAHALELVATILCPVCEDGNLNYRSNCQRCNGTGQAPYAIRLSDEALDRLAGALAKRLARQ